MNSELNQKWKEIEKSSLSISQMLVQANQDNLKEEIGSKSFNSLRLQQIAADEFLTPQQVSIPMTIPIKLQLKSGKAFDEVKALFDKIDQLEGAELSNLEFLRK